ncbi:putative bifunctional diguanylate cyclase/phosphodiesterase [Pseudoneobacillus sp. C159]
MRILNDMFETNQIKNAISTFQTLMRNYDTQLNQQLHDCIQDIIRFLFDFTYLKQAVDSSVILAATDIYGNILYANDKFCTLSKYSREELIGKNHRILNSGHHSKDFFKEMWKQINRGEVWEGEIKNKAKDGSIYWVKTTIVPLKDETGKPVMYMSIRTDITEGKLAQEKLVTNLQNDFRHMALHDHITNLPNRRKFNEDMECIITEATQNNQQNVAVFFLDLDRFKQINDSFGHTVGDHLIKEVSFRLKAAVGSKGIVYRFAGDEFIIVFPAIDNPESIQVYAKQILVLFEDVFILKNKLEIYTSPSIGVSIFPEHGEDYDTLLKNADTAMYLAKSNSRNNFSIYNQEMNQHYEEALLIEHHLRKAIESDELELYYQPKLDLRTGNINGVEALLRWNSPFLGSVPPSKFIPVAEDTGLIISLDEWVLEKACQQNKEWNSIGFCSPVKIAVNISPQHFRLPNFDSVVKKVLDKTGLSPHLLEIEITEHSFINNTEECITCLKNLNELGVSVAIDDFGIGYSSLNYLRKLPIHSLKIDRTFIQEMAANSEDIAIVKAITILAHELNLKVVAEGIESSEVISVLDQLGCDEIQGYYISRPLSKKDFEQNFRRINFEKIIQ